MGLFGKKKKDDHRAQLPTREESIADEMEKEDALDGDYFSYIKPKASGK